MRILKKILDVIAIILTGKDDESVDEGYCDYSGQGRDAYGR